MLVKRIVVFICLFYFVFSEQNLTNVALKTNIIKIHEVVIDDPNHRLAGLHEMIYLVETEDELKSLFSDFKCITTGYFDQKMFDVTSNFHWIFAGEKE